LQVQISDVLPWSNAQERIGGLARFGKIRAAYKKELKDPHDVFFDAEERKRERGKKSKPKP
jgi:hypothetical protein